jgi:phage terminase small subunit
VNLATVAGGDGAPPEPDWSSLYQDELDLVAAHEEWGIAIRELQQACTLSVANGHAVKRLVQFRIVYEGAARSVAENGTIQKAKRTRVPQVNPYWGVMRQASEEIRVLEVELGLPPVRRGRATKVERKQKRTTAADAYLKPVAK